MRKVWWYAMVIGAMGIVGYTAAVILMPGFGPPFVLARKVGMPWPLFGHLAGGLVALAMGPWQFVTPLRRRRPAVHRWMGRTYVGAVAVGGVAGFVLALRTDYGPVAASGFAALAVAWLLSTGMALARILAGDVAAHRRWMLRSFALTFAAVTLRIYLPVAGVLGIPFEVAYPPVAWICWVPNLLFAELRIGGGWGRLDVDPA